MWMSCLKNTDEISVDVMSEKKTNVKNVNVMSEIHWCHKYRCQVKYIDIINVDVMSEKHRMSNADVISEKTLMS